MKFWDSSILKSEIGYSIIVTTYATLEVTKSKIITYKNYNVCLNREGRVELNKNSYIFPKDKDITVNFGTKLLNPNFIKQD